VENINAIANKYGWTAQEIAGNVHLFNRKGVDVATIKEKGAKYTIYHSSTDLKIMSGRGQLGKSVEYLLSQYFFCQPLNS
jgi:hypothetical protein